MKITRTLGLLLTGLTLSSAAVAQHEYKDIDFTITFPTDNVTKSSEMIETDIGYVELNMHMCEVSAEEVYMVAENRYHPDSLGNADPWILIEGGRDGAAQSLGIEKLDMEERTDIDGNPCLRFKGNNGTYYVYYEIALVGSTLFQIAILKAGKYPKDKDSEAFVESFDLHMDDAESEERAHPGPPKK